MSGRSSGPPRSVSTKKPATPRKRSHASRRAFWRRSAASARANASPSKCDCGVIARSLLQLRAQITIRRRDARLAERRRMLGRPMAEPTTLTLYGEPFWASPYVFSCFVALREKGLPFTVVPVELARRASTGARRTTTAPSPAKCRRSPTATSGSPSRARSSSTSRRRLPGAAPSRRPADEPRRRAPAPARSWPGSAAT